VNAPELFSLVVALWLGTFLYFSMVPRAASAGAGAPTRFERVTFAFGGSAKLALRSQLQIAAYSLGDRAVALF
jgi:hypothetical protein